MWFLFCLETKEADSSLLTCHVADGLFEDHFKNQDQNKRPDQSGRKLDASWVLPTFCLFVLSWNALGDGKLQTKSNESAMRLWMS